MAVRGSPATSRTDPRQAKGAQLQRLQLTRFQAWQRSTPKTTPALVRLVRLLAR